MCRGGVNVASGQGESRAGGELLPIGRAVMPAEHDIRCQQVARKTRHLRKFLMHELAQGRAQAEMMGRDVDGQHGCVDLVHKQGAMKCSSGHARGGPERSVGGGECDHQCWACARRPVPRGSVSLLASGREESRPGRVSRRLARMREDAALRARFEVGLLCRSIGSAPRRLHLSRDGSGSTGGSSIGGTIMNGSRTSVVRPSTAKSARLAAAATAGGEWGLTMAPCSSAISRAIFPASSAGVSRANAQSNAGLSVGGARSAIMARGSGGVPLTPSV